MSESADNQEYYRRRAQAARERAMQAAEPGVRKIHLEMAERYAARSVASEPVMNSISPAVNKG